MWEEFGKSNLVVKGGFQDRLRWLRPTRWESAMHNIGLGALLVKWIQYLSVLFEKKLR